MSLCRLSSALIASVLLCLSRGTLHGQRGAERGNTPAGVVISPDGATVAWTLARPEGTTLHLTSVDNPDPAKDQIIAPNGATNCSNTAPVWSPDSATLAFTSTCTSKEEKPGQEQVFLWSKASGEVRQLTHITGLFKQAAWSPDGKTLAFLFVENATRSAGALDAMKPWAGVIGEDALEIQGVYGVRLGSSKGAWLVKPSPELYTFEFTWAPKSDEISFIGAPAPGENNWWVAKLYTKRLGPLASDCLGGGSCSYNGPLEGFPSIALDPSTVPGLLHGLQIAVPRYSPDGTKIALIGGLMSDQGSTGGDVWIVPTQKNNRYFLEPCTKVGCANSPVDITSGMDGTATYEAWTGPDNIGFVEDRRGHNLLTDYVVSTRKQDAQIDLGEAVVAGGQIKSAIGVSSQGVLTFVKSGPAFPAEVWAGPWNNFKQLTHLHSGAPASAAARIESVEWENEGFHVQGWLTFPKDYDATRKYPLIVTVHGGPTSSAFPRGAGQWSNLGYFEFQPNPRGSMGQGEAFVQANRKDFGYGDLRDILKGMDTIEARYPIDKNREGLTGWSYGGFMTMFAVTQTHRFRAAVAGAGISNWKSYYGENSIDQWMVPFFGATVYDDPAIYAKSSAIEFIKNVKTPTLVIVGDRDGECPAPQSFEFWHALHDQGVKTQLVVYPNEGHGFRDPAHIGDRNERTAKWFANNMPESR